MPIDRVPRTCAAGLALLVLAAGTAIAQTPAGRAPSKLSFLGQKLFFDTSLSGPPGQSCADCHGPAVGFTGPNEAVNRGGGVYPGAVHERFGNRKPPSAAYAEAPPLSTRVEDGQTVFFGGSFWDGRATGSRLGSALAEQALGPFLNPLEQNMRDASTVVAAACAGPYGALLREVAKERGIADACARGQASATYDVIGFAIAAYETSPAAQPFSSRYDRYLAGKGKLTPQEMRGLSLFDGKAKCGECHPSGRDRKGRLPLFTDFTYDNTGLPPNPVNPFYGMGPEYNLSGKAWKDPGLGGYLATEPRWAKFAERNIGKFKVPTLRNVDRRPSPGFAKAYGHNGVFKTLEEVVHFYNTRDVLPVCGSVQKPVPGKNCWPASEESRNVEREKSGNLRLTADEEAAIVAFLKTLTDEGPSRR